MSRLGISIELLVLDSVALEEEDVDLMLGLEF
jgi:hypothetical protein